MVRRVPGAAWLSAIAHLLQPLIRRVVGSKLARAVVASEDGVRRGEHRKHRVDARRDVEPSARYRPRVGWRGGVGLGEIGYSLFGWFEGASKHIR